jgi:Putative rhamnosyl transferase
MAKFEHLILTKFNTKSFENSQKGCDPEWLAVRFKLFDEFCYPSVFAQVNQNFKWLVYFDEGTPAVFKEKIEKYTEWKNFIPIFVDSVLPYGEFPEKIRRITSQYIANDCDYLITTWLDNDDIIHVDYINMVQDHFNAQDSETINFLLGYQLCDGKLYLDIELANHFISLVEKYNPESFHTVLSRPHKQLYEVASSVKKIVSKPCWIEVVHDGNYKNVLRKGMRVPVGNKSKEFIVASPSETLSPQDNVASFLGDQLKSINFFPLYVGRKLFLRFKHHKFNDLSVKSLRLYRR